MIKVYIIEDDRDTVEMLSIRFEQSRGFALAGQSFSGLHAIEHIPLASPM